LQPAGFVILLAASFLQGATMNGEAKVEDEVTATRYTLSEEWRAMREKVDWMHAPGMAAYVNGMVSGRSMEDGGHWAAYAKREHVEVLFNKRKRGIFPKPRLSMLSLGCGSGHIESSLLGQHEWPVSRLVGLEYDERLRSHAAEHFKTEFPKADVEFCRFDFDHPTALDEQFDIVFCCHAIHHATDLEAFLPAINRYLKDDGLFVGIDFFGPTRFQIEHDVLPIIREIFDLLPAHFRRDLRDPEGAIVRSFEADSIKIVRDADVSESVRSSDLRTLLFSNFPVIDMKPMGGTLLRWLLQYRAGNFLATNPDHVAIVRLLQLIEREMIASRKIRSDDLFFVLGKSARL
jgi:SAM-dependent methyltransferase